MSREGEAMFGNGTATATHSLSSPRMRGIQYAAASPLPRWRLWNTGSRGRVEPGDDEKWRSKILSRSILVIPDKRARRVPIRNPSPRVLIVAHAGASRPTKPCLREIKFCPPCPRQGGVPHDRAGRRAEQP